MTEYVQLRKSDKTVTESEFLAADARRAMMVTNVANDLLAAWFPESPHKGPQGEDLENWKNIAISDAIVAVNALLVGAWIDDPTMD